MKLIIITSIVLTLVLVGIIIISYKEISKENFKEEIKDSKKELTFEEEKLLIDKWIQEQDLNQNGDPKDTVYTGGTPLFNEATGERIDRYDYILEKHPERPWQTNLKPEI